MTLSRVSHFLRAEAGAVTADLVVLAAAIVGLGLGAVSAVSSGTASLGGGIETSLTCARVASLSDSYVSGYLAQDLADNRQNTYANASTDAIVSWHRSRVAELELKIRTGQLTNDAWVESSPWTNLGAGQVLDIVEMHARELQARGAYPIDGLTDIDTLRQMFTAAFGC